MNRALEEEYYGRREFAAHIFNFNAPITIIPSTFAAACTMFQGIGAHHLYTLATCLALAKQLIAHEECVLKIFCTAGVGYAGGGQHVNAHTIVVER